MGFLSDLVKFQNVFSKDFGKDILKKPQRLLTGIDPASTKVWNKVLGRDDKPLVNVFGSPGKQYYENAAAKGIDTKAAGTFHSIADMIAGFYGAQGIAGIGGSGPAGYMGMDGAVGNATNKALINSGMKMGNNLSNDRSTFDGVLQAGLTSGIKSGANSMGNGMSGFGDFFSNMFSGSSSGGSTGSGDETDWLSMIETNLGDSKGPYNPDFIDYGNLGGGDSSYTISDTFGDTNYFDTLFSNLGSLQDSGDSQGFMGALMKQFGNLGENAKKNPIGALNSLLGAYGSYREATGGEIPPGMLNAVDKLMMEGDMRNAYTPQPVAYKNPVARDSRHFIQSYDKDGNATQESRNDALTNDMYQKVLGRNADVGGLKHWSGVMDKGMTSGQLSDQLSLSPENQINKAYRDLLGRNPDFDGQNFFTDQMNKGLRPDQLRNALTQSPEMQMGHIFRQELGRNPDAEGLAFYSDALKRGMTMDDLQAALRNSPEGLKRAAPAPAPAPGPAPAPATPTAIAPPPGPLTAIGGGNLPNYVQNKGLDIRQYME